VDNLQVAVHNHLFEAFVAVAHDDEVLGQFARLIQHREVALVFSHHANQNFRRQVFEVTRLKSPQHAGRALHQVCHFLQQVRVIRQFSTNAFRELAGLLPHQGLTPFGRQNDALRL